MIWPIVQDLAKKNTGKWSLGWGWWGWRRCCTSPAEPCGTLGDPCARANCLTTQSRRSGVSQDRRRQRAGCGGAQHDRGYADFHAFQERRDGAQNGGRLAAGARRCCGKISVKHDCGCPAPARVALVNKCLRRIDNGIVRHVMLLGAGWSYRI